MITQRDRALDYIQGVIANYLEDVTVKRLAAEYEGEELFDLATSIQ